MLKSGEKPLPSRDEVKAILLKEIEFEPRKKIVDLMGARNRVTAEDIYAERSLPTTFTYGEDGIAINFANLEALQQKTFLVEGVDYVHADAGWPQKADFDTICPLGEVILGDKTAQVLNWPKEQGAFLRRPGELIEKGELIVPAYTVINGPVMGLLAMGGVQGVTVLSRPRIIFIPTGDELVEWQEQVEAGENIESNSVMLAGFAEELRCKLEVMPIVPDDEDALADALHYAKELADLVIISAGTSRGKKDFTKSILAEEGEVIVSEVGCDPGRYMSVSKLKNKPILSLPGSPRGVELTMGFYLPTIINKYYHQYEMPKEKVEVVAEFGYTAAEHLDACLEIFMGTDEQGVLRGTMISGGNPIKGRAVNARRGLYYLARGQSIAPGDKILVELR